MRQFQKISIVGGGLSAWMMCAFLVKQLQDTDTTITLYSPMEVENTPTFQSPLPFFNDFARMINVEHEELMKRGFWPKLGNAFLFDNQQPFFHTWSQYGAPLGVCEFHQLVRRAINSGHNLDLNKLSIASASILANKFSVPTTNTASILSTYEASWSFETSAFLELLKSICRLPSVEVIDVKIHKIIHGADQVSLVDHLGKIHTTDYLINTLFDLAVSDTAASPVENWFSRLPFERISEDVVKNNFSSLANIVSGPNNALWSQDLSHKGFAQRTMYGFLQADHGRVFMNPCPRSDKVLHFGAALANFHSPVFSSMDINLAALKLLSQYFPSPSESSYVADIFNRSFKAVADEFADITQLCLKLLQSKSGRTEPKIFLSDQASYKLQLFEDRGRLPLAEANYYKNHWQTWLLLGLGCKVKQVDPLSSFVDEQAVLTHIKRVETRVLKELQSIPTIS